MHGACKLLGNQAKTVSVWMDGIIEWIEKEHKPSEEIHQAVELLLLKTASFDFSSPIFIFTLASFRESLQTSQIAYNADTLTTSIPLKTNTANAVLLREIY